MRTRLVSKMINTWCRILSLVLALAAAVPAIAADWTRWRGPEQNGVSREKNLVDAFDPDTGQNVLWKNDIAGMSSPIVMKGKLYAWTRVGEVKVNNTTVVGPETQEALVCADAETGRPLWEYRLNMTQTEVPFHRLGWGNVVGDPETNRVYGYGVQGQLVCLDATDGSLVWRRHMTEEFGMITTFGGRTQSPNVDENQLLLSGVSFGWGDHAQGAHRIFAFDKKTGTLNWSAAVGGRPVDAPYGTPIVAVIGGQRIVCTLAGDGGVYGVKARTGDKVFGYKLSKRGNNDTVLVVDNKLICSSSEENPDNSQLGRVVCLDISQINEQGEPKELWRVDGIEAGFPSPTTDGSAAYICDNKGTVHAIDIGSGKVLWKQVCGTIGKASLVYADGKIYAAEANGRFVVIRPAESGQKKAKVLSKIELSADAQQLGREYFIFGSPAIANGRFYLQTAGGTYCFGSKEPVETVNSSNPIQAMPKEEPADPAAAPARVQVVPADVVLAPGESVQFTVRTFDAKGRLLKEAAPAEWSVGPVTIPPPPTALPGTEPAKVGNLKGAITADGKYTAEAGPSQGGAIFAAVKAGEKSVAGFARIRVLPRFPVKIDFEASPLGKPPLTWIGAGGKFQVRELPDKNHVLLKTLDLDLYHIARTYFGDAHLSNYTIESDVMVGAKQAGGQRYMPDAGVINSRYTLVLYGNHQECMLIAWTGALPKEGQLGSTLLKTVPFKWEPETWYRLKLAVGRTGSQASVKGKVWKKDDKEPESWTLELVDNRPNIEGSPGLFGESLVTPYKSEIYYDNILVSENK